MKKFISFMKLAAFIVVIAVIVPVVVGVLVVLSSLACIGIGYLVFVVIDPHVLPSQIALIAVGASALTLVIILIGGVIDLIGVLLD